MTHGIQLDGVILKEDSAGNLTQDRQHVIQIIIANGQMALEIAGVNKTGQKERSVWECLQEMHAMYCLALDATGQLIHGAMEQGLEQHGARILADGVIILLSKKQIVGYIQVLLIVEEHLDAAGKQIHMRCLIAKQIILRIAGSI